MVRLELDTEKREVKPPADLVKALKASPAALERWRALSYTHQREHVEAIEDAKKPETRVRRIAAAVSMLMAVSLAGAHDDTSSRILWEPRSSRSLPATPSSPNTRQPLW